MLDNLRIVLDCGFMKTVVGRMDDNQAILKRVLDDPEFQSALNNLHATWV